MFNPDGPREGGGRGIEVGSDLFRVIVPARGVFVPCKRHWAGEGEGRPPKPQHPKRQQLGPVDDGFFYVRTYVAGRVH